MKKTVAIPLKMLSKEDFLEHIHLASFIDAAGNWDEIVTTFRASSAAIVRLVVNL